MHTQIINLPFSLAIYHFHILHQHPLPHHHTCYYQQEGVRAAVLRGHPDARAAQERRSACGPHPADQEAAARWQVSQCASVVKCCLLFVLYCVVCVVV